MSQLRVRALGANAGTVRGPILTQAASLTETREAFILLRPDLGPEDVTLLERAQAVVLTRAGLTGDGAIMARALAKPCVAGASMIAVNGGRISIRSDGPGGPSATIVDEGVVATIDGRTGEIWIELPDAPEREPPR